MQIDKHLFSVNTFELNPKVLIRPHQADTIKGKNVVIEDEMPISPSEKGVSRKVVLEKSPDGQESLKIIIQGSRHGGQVPQPKMIKPKNPEVGK